jgi:hypothetical protein
VYQIRKLETQFGQMQVSQAAKEAFQSQAYKPWNAARLSSEVGAQDVLDQAIDSLCAACETLLDPSGTIQHAFEVLADCALALSEACLFDEAVVLTDHVLCIARLVAADTMCLAGRTWLIRWLNSSSNVLKSVGQYERALLVSVEAVDIAREVEKESSMLQPELSRSLYILASRRNVLGQSMGALCAIEEAVQLDRRLASQRSDEASSASLAVSLNLLSHIQRINSRPLPALESATEATQLFRGLYATSPDLYCADLATCLTAYANRQSVVGNADAALLACEEACQLFRNLYALRPARYR